MGVSTGCPRGRGGVENIVGFGCACVGQVVGDADLMLSEKTLAGFQSVPSGFGESDLFTGHGGERRLGVDLDDAGVSFGHFVYFEDFGC